MSGGGYWASPVSWAWRRAKDQSGGETRLLHPLHSHTSRISQFCSGSTYPPLYLSGADCNAWKGEGGWPTSLVTVPSNTCGCGYQKLPWSDCHHLTLNPTLKNYRSELDRKVKTQPHYVQLVLDRWWFMLYETEVLGHL